MFPFRIGCVYFDDESRGHGSQQMETRPELSRVSRRSLFQIGIVAATGTGLADIDFPPRAGAHPDSQRAVNLREKFRGRTAGVYVGSSLGVDVEGWDWQRVQKESGGPCHIHKHVTVLEADLEADFGRAVRCVQSTYRQNEILRVRDGHRVRISTGEEIHAQTTFSRKSSSGCGRPGPFAGRAGTRSPGGY